MANKKVNMGGDIMEMDILCNICHGKGKGGHANCPFCKGKKITMQPRDI